MLLPGEKIRRVKRCARLISICICRRFCEDDAAASNVSGAVAADDAAVLLPMLLLLLSMLSMLTMYKMAAAVTKNKAAAMKVRDRVDGETAAGALIEDVLRGGVSDSSLLTQGVSRFLTSNHAVSRFSSTPSQTKVKSSNNMND